MTDKDRKAYAHWLREGSRKHKVQIHAWVFMTNHIHLLVTPIEEMAVARMMQYVGCQYVPYYNRAHERTGTLWEGRYRSSLVQENEYFLCCQRYIELNPVRAGMTKSPADYDWSSFRANALGIPSTILTPHALYLELGKTKNARLENYRQLFNDCLDSSVLDTIRYTLDRGLVLGTEKFQIELEELTKGRVRAAKRGRPPKRRKHSEQTTVFSL